MLFDILVWFEQAYQWASLQWKIQKQFLREWLGPQPQDYLLLNNGDIVPAHTQLPPHIGTLRFQSSTHTISGPTEGRRVPLPWLTLEHSCNTIRTDLTDVVSEIRCTKDHIPSLLQTVRLVALLRNEYLSESNARIITTNNMGEQEVYEYKNTTTLEQVS
jgi:hypothetical protein